MLDVLRRNAGSWAIKIILGFVALTFIWWGVGSYSERGRDVAATVGKAKISMTELAEAMGVLEKTYRDAYGGAFTPEMAKTLNIRKQALETLINRTLLLSEAERMGLTATDTEVRQDISATPAFQVNGQFNEDRYRRQLANSRIAPAEYEVERRRDITLKKMEGLLASSARVPESEARYVFAMTARKVRLLVVSADPEKETSVPPPSEAEVSAKFEQTKESYRIPARVKLLAARFEPGFFAKGLSPGEEEIRAFYEGNSDRFRTEEERLVSQIYIPYGRTGREEVLKKVAVLLASAREGKESFEKLAKQYSKTKPGETWVRRRELKTEVADAAFSAPVDTVVGPMEVLGGILLLRVNRIKFPESLPLPQVRDRVVELLRHEKGKDLAVIKAYEAHTKAAGSRDLKSACADYGIAPVETGWTTGDSKSDPVPPAVVQEALLLPTRDIGPVKTVGDSHYLFQVVAKEDSRLPPLADVRGKVVAAVFAEKKRATARAELQKVLTGSKTAGELEQRARKIGLSATTTAFFSPLADRPPESLPPSAEIRKILLSLSRNTPVSEKILEAGNRFLALALVDEQSPGEKEWAEKKEALLLGLSEQKKNQLIEAFISEQRRKSQVEINPEALK